MASYSKSSETMLDERNWRTVDNYFEHDLHDEFDSHCSSCFQEKHGCKYSDCRAGIFNPNAPYGCESCVSHAESFGDK